MTTVLMTTDAVGGVWTYSLDLVHALAARGVDVALAVVGPSMSPARRAELDAAPVTASVELEGALEWMDDPWRDVDASGQRLLGIAAGVGADVVHLGGYAHAALPWGVPTVVVAHSDVLSWWRAVHGTPAPPSWDEYRRRVRTGARAASALVAPTEAASRALALELDGDLAPVTVIANGRRGGWVQRRPKEPFVLSAGRLWDPAKNLAALAAVAPRLRWPVVVAGDGERTDAGHVRWLGPLPFPELATWLARAAVYAAPARYEPFGLAVLEAAMCGCALVLGDVPSLREVWGDAAVYVDPDDHDALQRTLVGLLGDPQRCAELGRRAREHAGRYGIERTADACCSLYGSLLERAVPAR